MRRAARILALGVALALPGCRDSAPIPACPGDPALGCYGFCEAFVADAGPLPDAGPYPFLPTPFCEAACAGQCAAVCGEAICRPDDAGTGAVRCRRQCLYR